MPKKGGKKEKEAKSGRKHRENQRKQGLKPKKLTLGEKYGENSQLLNDLLKE